MNAAHLRTTLRTGGWGAHATNLPSKLLLHGLPYEESHKGHTLRISLAPDGGLEAYVLGSRHGALLVATETHVVLRIEKVPGVPKASLAGAVTGVRLSPVDLNRLAKAVRRTGRSRSDIIRRAIRSHLDSMEVV
jgi:hypothetical protein